jgi:hypothetical protein
MVKNRWDPFWDNLVSLEKDCNASSFEMEVKKGLKSTYHGRV